MKNFIVSLAIVLTATSAVSPAQTPPAAAQPAPPAVQAAPPSEQPSTPLAETASATEGLSDLDAMTFACPKAALNAAAREAAKAPSQGTYQFAYFKIVSNSHHSAYEVHFKSNYVGEPDLKYCVALYCQQGWDPKNTKADVMLMGDAQKPAAAMAHGAHCADTEPAKPRAKKK
ncbi:MAG: hypothetical protein WDO56_17200 [Gammaproteobacteria bacterium]